MERQRRFAYDQTQLIGEYRQDGSPEQETLWMNGQPVAVIQQGRVYYVHSGPIGEPRAISDARQQIVWRWEPRPFGDSTADEDPDGDGRAFGFNLRFPGQYFDRESGLYYNYFRYYDPTTGRYITSDPIGLNGGLNTYAYVGGNPLVYADPSGLNAYAAARGAFWVGGRIGAGINYGIQAATGANLGVLVYEALNDLAEDAQDDTQPKSCPNDDNGDECKNLNDKVTTAKNKVGQLGACRAGMSRDELMTRKQAWLELATARAQRDQKCWNGGDLGHQQAQASAWGHVGRCASLMK